MITVHEIAAALKARATGCGWLARCPVHEDTRPSLSIRQGKTGRILVHCHAGCTQADVIAALAALGLWPRRTSHDRPRAAPDPERAGDMARARYWKISAMALAEELLETITLDDPTRFPLTRMVAALRLGDDAVLAEYRAYRARDPQLTAGLVYAGRLSDAAVQRRLAWWIRGGMDGAFE